MEVVNTLLLRGPWEGDTASCGALDKVFTESDRIPSRIGAEAALTLGPAPPGSSRLDLCCLPYILPWEEDAYPGRRESSSFSELSRSNGFKIMG